MTGTPRMELNIERNAVKKETAWLDVPKDEITNCSKCGIKIWRKWNLIDGDMTECILHYK